jgi:hypothetical protein
MSFLLYLISAFCIVLVIRLTLHDAHQKSDELLDESIEKLEYNFRRRLISELNTLHAETNKQFSNSALADNYKKLIQGEIDTLYLWSAHVQDSLNDPAYSHNAKRVLRLVWLQYLRSYPPLNGRQKRIALRSSRLDNLHAAQEDVMAVFSAFGYNAKADHDYALERLRLQKRR